MNRTVGLPAIALILIFIAAPAMAQWERVPDVPASDIFSVWASPDTIVGGADSTVFVSTNGGATWQQSEKVAAGVTSIEAVSVRNGRIFAGTFGQGVFTSDDLGDTWQAFNQGLAGGLFNTHLFISDLLVQGDSLYASTSGAGVYVRNLVAGTWNHFGEVFEANSASNTNDIAAGGGRLLVSSGFNGTVFVRGPVDAEWTRSWLNNVGLAPGLAALSAAWSGSGWVVGANTGVFLSATGQEPWTFVDLQMGTLFSVSFVARGPDLFASFGTGPKTVTSQSPDGGATWNELDTQFAVFVYRLAMSGTELYAGRADGLWHRATSTPVRTTTWSGLKSLGR